MDFETINIEVYEASLQPFPFAFKDRYKPI